MDHTSLIIAGHHQTPPVTVHDFLLPAGERIAEDSNPHKHKTRRNINLWVLYK